MDMELGGKHVFIAGASRGIGFGMTEAFLREGAKVTLTGRGEASLDEARKKLTGKGVPEAQLCTIAGDMTMTNWPEYGPLSVPIKIEA